MQQILTIDHEILYFICNSFRNSFLDPIMLFVTRLGDGGMVWIFIALIFLLKKQTRIIGVSMLLSLLVGLIIGNMIMKPFFQRPRPFKTYSDIINMINQGGYSFPSGHSLSSFTAATSFYLCAKYQNNIMSEIRGYNTRLIFGKLFLVLAALIAFSRLYVGVHYPTDVLCGSIIGIVIAVITVKIMIKKFPAAFTIKE